MNNYTCTCPIDNNEQACKVHKKSRYRNPWKCEDEQLTFSEEDISE